MKKEMLEKSTLLTKVINKLNKLKIPYDNVIISPKPDKKIRITFNGKNIDFGAKNSTTYLEQKNINFYVFYISCNIGMPYSQSLSYNR